MSEAYHVEPNNPFFHAALNIVEKESMVRTTMAFAHLVDLTEVEEVREDYAKAGKDKPSYTAFVVCAVGRAIKDFPTANRRVIRPWWSLFSPRLLAFHHCDLSVAVSKEAPELGDHVTFVDLLRDSDQKPLMEVHQWLHALTTSDTKNNQQWKEFSTVVKSFPPLLAGLMIYSPVMFPRLWVRYRGAAVMISSPGKYGADEWTANLTCPMGFTFGYVKKRPLVVNDQMLPRLSVHLKFNCDRRILAGAPSSRFFMRVIEYLEKAKTLLNS